MVKRDRYAAAKVSGTDTREMVIEDALALADVALAPVRDPKVRAAIADATFLHNHFVGAYLDYPRGWPTLRPEVSPAEVGRLGELINLLSELNIGPKLKDLIDAAESVRDARERRRAAKLEAEHVSK